MLHRLIPNSIFFESTVQENKNNDIIKDTVDMGADLKVKITVQINTTVHGTQYSHFL